MPSDFAAPVFYPAIEPYRSGALAVDTLHTLYCEESGNPDGLPVLFLHGGPGGGSSPRHRCFFDPAYYRIVIFDQRGAGKSTPLGECRDNTTPLLVSDIEVLRRLLGIDAWLIFGGSWGATLALAYGEQHPEHCLGFILRGIFLCTAAEIDWFLRGMRAFFPEAHAEFVSLIPVAERDDLLQAYADRLFSEDASLYRPAARAWSRYEGSCSYLRPNTEAIDEFSTEAVSLGIGRLEAHYFLHHGFLEEDQLIRNIGRIRHLPAVIVQGRYDVVCPPFAAWRLRTAWPKSVLRMVGEAGHSAHEPAIAAALLDATRQYRDTGTFGEP